jgi:hypothetical protein
MALSLLQSSHGVVAGLSACLPAVYQLAQQVSCLPSGCTSCARFAKDLQLLSIANQCTNRQHPCRALSAVPEPQPQELTVTVNGRAVTVPQGASLYDAAAKLGAFVPILCKHPRLPNTPGACRCVPSCAAG